MTPEQIESAARRYCKMTGIDPDTIIIGHQDGTIKAWHQVAELIRIKLDDNILSEAILIEQIGNQFKNLPSGYYTVDKQTGRIIG